MPGLITKLDGIHAILFHVEHIPDVPWFYRWRILGNFPESYLVWRGATSTVPHVMLRSEARGALIEAEWRASEEAEWEKVKLLELTPPACQFSIHAERAFTAADPFIACSPVRADGVAAYQFPALTLEAGQETIVTARADAAAWPNVLLAPGEFAPVVDGLTILNTQPSTAWCREIPGSAPIALTACPVACARRWFAVGRHPVDPSLLPAS